MNKRRLLKLADLLEADAKSRKGVKFDITDWGNSEGEAPSLSCGTTACAMGLAVISGAFKRAGLGGNAINPFCPTFNGGVGFDAAAGLFGITLKQSRFLFDSYNYPINKQKGAVGERYVAKRIRDFVAGKVSA